MVYILKGDIPRARADLTKALDLQVAMLKNITDNDRNYYENSISTIREDLACGFRRSRPCIPI